MKKGILFVMMLSVLGGCVTTKLNLYLGDSNKEIYDLSITRISEKQLLLGNGKVVVSIANDKYVILTPGFIYSESVSKIATMLNGSYVIQSKDIPDLLNSLKSIIAAYDSEVDKSSLRVIKYEAYIKTGRVISSTDYYKNWSQTEQNNEYCVLFGIQYVNASKGVGDSGGYTKLYIDRSKIDFKKKDVVNLFKDVSLAFSKIEKNRK